MTFTAITFSSYRVEITDCWLEESDWLVIEVDFPTIQTQFVKQTVVLVAQHELLKKQMKVMQIGRVTMEKS